MKSLCKPILSTSFLLIIVINMMWTFSLKSYASNILSPLCTCSQEDNGNTRKRNDKDKPTTSNESLSEIETCTFPNVYKILDLIIKNFFNVYIKEIIETLHKKTTNYKIKKKNRKNKKKKKKKLKKKTKRK